MYADVITRQNEIIIIMNTQDEERSEVRRITLQRKVEQAYLRPFVPFWVGSSRFQTLCPAVPSQNKKSRITRLEPLYTYLS